MSRRHAFVPSALAPLEDRVVPSQGGTAVPQAIAVSVEALAKGQRLLSLVGTIQGTEATLAVPGASRLVGGGGVAPLGATSLSGRLQETGAEPTAFRATVVLRTGRGSLTVGLQGFQFGPVILPEPPVHLAYTILGGTGSFRNARGTGQATLSEVSPTAGSVPKTAFSLTFGDVIPPQQTLNLTGVIQGRYTQLNSTSTSTPPYQLQGDGSLSPLGMASANGSLTIQGGEPTIGDGALVLTNNQGTVTLHLSGLQGGPAMLSHLRYDIVGGTGAYQNAKGSGPVDFALGGPILIIDPLPGGRGGRSGSFSLTFGAATPPVLPQA